MFKAQSQAEQFDRLRAELQRAFAVPLCGYARLDAEMVIARNRRG